MKWFYYMKISTKLILAFVIVAIISGIVGVIGITNIIKINENDNILYQNMTVPLSEVANMARLFQRARVNARDLILYDDVSDIKNSYDRINNFLKEIAVLEESFEKTIIQEEIKVAFAEYNDAMATFKADLAKLLELCLQNYDDAAFEFTKGQLQESADAVRGAIDKLIEFKVTGAEKQAVSNDMAAQTSIYTMIAVIACAMVVAIGLGIFISNTITKPLRTISVSAERIADGDLDVYVDIHTKEELGSLAASFNTMVNNLNELISSINLAAEQVTSGSKQLSESSVELSQGAAEQASTIEELSSSLEELAAQTRLNADNSNQANSLAETAKDNAVQGNSHMKDMLKAMEEINMSSNNISKIIKVIDEIAFQTNILALNAAVEAARAGQHGKGFAVVAEEVRNLAARSASAAKETTEMIEDSIKNVEKGTAIAQKTSEALNRIVDDVSKVAKLIDDIAVASNEQAAGIEQINQGIVMVSDVVQKNTATAEESAAASEELSSQAEMLKQQVSKFKLRKGLNGTSEFWRMNNLKTDASKRQDYNSDDSQASSKDDDTDNKANTMPKKIILSDSEFGKY